MPKLLTVSRAARLVGVSRGTLQKKIQDGELQSFEGQVDIDELTTAYPEAQVEDNAMLDKIEQIIDSALKRARGDKLRKLLTPDLSTLALRVAELSKELARLKAIATFNEDLLVQTATRLKQLSSSADSSPQLAELSGWLEDELGKPLDAINANPLLAQDTLLRVMAAQVHLMPSGHEFFVEGNTSILDAGLSAGLTMNYGCSSGNCGKCKSRLISGEVKKIRAHDYVIPEEEQKQGYILACSNTAITDIVLAADEALDENDIPLQTVAAKIKKVDVLSQQLAILHLRTPRTERLRFMAGQKAILSHNEIPAHDYTIASCPCDDMNLQFHIPYSEDIPFSKYIFEQAKSGDIITTDGPSGHFVLDTESELPIIFIAFDTGFALIKSLIEHTLTLDAAEYTHLFWLVSAHHTHYQHNICRAWADAFDNFRYNPETFNDINSRDEVRSQLRQLIRKYPDITDYRVYVAGPELAINACTEFFDSRGLPQTQLFTEVL